MMLLRPLFAVLLLASLAVAQDAAPVAKKPRLHVIGASVSGGFRDGPMTGAQEQGDSVTLQHVLKAWCGEQARATTHAPIEMMAMFTNPEPIGERQVQATLKAQPDAVVAIDFPFWFAYGYVDGEESKARRERLAKGLAMLAKIEVPMLVGDLPDMQGAARRMLAPAQIPSPAVLQELNAQLAAWVSAHANVKLVALAGMVQTMKQDGAVLPLVAGPLQSAPGALLQGDKLHANRLGMAFLGLTLQPALRELFPKDHPLHTQQWTLEQFVAACGAEAELEAVRSAAKKPAGDVLGK